MEIQYSWNILLYLIYNNHRYLLGKFLIVLLISNGSIIFLGIECGFSIFLVVDLLIDFRLLCIYLYVLLSLSLLLSLLLLLLFFNKLYFLTCNSAYFLIIFYINFYNA